MIKYSYVPLHYPRNIELPKMESKTLAEVGLSVKEYIKSNIENNLRPVYIVTFCELKGYDDCEAFLVDNVNTLDTFITQSIAPLLKGLKEPCIGIYEYPEYSDAIEYLQMLKDGVKDDCYGGNLNPIVFDEQDNAINLLS